MKRIFHFSLPLVAVFFGAGIGKWVSWHKHWLLLTETRLGKTLAHLLLDADNPSLILGALSLLFCFILLKRDRISGADAEQFKE